MRGEFFFSLKVIGIKLPAPNFIAYLHLYIYLSIVTYVTSYRLKLNIVVRSLVNILQKLFITRRHQMFLIDHYERLQTTCEYVGKT